MAIREIVKYTDDFVRKVSKPVTVFDDKLDELLDDMHETLDKARGAGLSAVQVGVLKRVFIINISGVNMEFINPEILSTHGEQYKQEGCLSVPGKYDYVKRPQRLTVKAYDRYGNEFIYTCEDWVAVCISHEYDHLNGELFIDKVCTPPKKKKKGEE